VIILAGGYENQTEEEYQHYAYINEKGVFERKLLPIGGFSASVVRPFDYDHDGDLDLFIGSRIKKTCSLLEQIPGF
jgi:enediyne biosynthesis protein E4